MYEDTIRASAQLLSTRGDKAATKLDHTFTERMTEMLAKLDSLGFGAWRPGVWPVPQDGRKLGERWGDPRTVIDGTESSTGATVQLELYNTKGKLVPKNLTFRLRNLATGRALVVGQHVGQFRITDLRTKQSQYDGDDWGPTKFRMFLAVAAFREKLAIPVGTIEQHMAKAIAKLEELGITEVQHCLLPESGSGSIQSRAMVPYLVGKYGDMPVAIELTYKQVSSITLRFFIISGGGQCETCFGHCEVDVFGKAEGEVDIASLLKAPKKK